MVPPLKSITDRMADSTMSSTGCNSRAGPIWRLTRASSDWNSRRLLSRSCAVRDCSRITSQSCPVRVARARRGGAFPQGLGRILTDRSIWLAGRAPGGPPMPTAVIVDAVRTAGGKRNGKLKDWHPVDLAAETLKALVERNDLDPALVEDVIMGCVMQTGAQGLNIGRNAALAAGFPESVVGTSVDRQCGSSQQTAHFAAQGVMAGAYDVVIAAGVEVMTLVPMGITMNGPGMPFGPKVMERFAPAGGLVPQGISAEVIADKWNLSRDDLDAFSVESHKRAARATEEGRFQNEIIPINVDIDGTKEVFDRDEGIRPDSSMESLAK